MLKIFKLTPYIAKNIEKLKSTSKNVALNNVLNALEINNGIFKYSINNTSLLNDVNLQQELFNHIKSIHKLINNKSPYQKYEKLKPETYKLFKKIVYNNKSSYYKSNCFTKIERDHVHSLVEDIHYLIAHRHHSKLFNDLQYPTHFTRSISKLLCALDYNKQKISQKTSCSNQVINETINTDSQKNFSYKLKHEAHKFTEEFTAKYYNKQTKVAKFKYDTSINGYSFFRYFNNNYGFASTRKIMKEKYKETEKIEKEWSDFLYFIENNKNINIKTIKLSISEYFYTSKLKELCNAIVKNSNKIKNLCIKFCAKDKPILSRYDKENLHRLVNVENLILKGFDNVNLT